MANLDIKATFCRSDGVELLCCQATGNVGKQQEFSITSGVVDIPGNVSAVVTTVGGTCASTSRLIPQEEESKDKFWAKVGKLGDPFIVQILLKKGTSGLWKVKKFVVTYEQSKIQLAVPKAPRITCQDPEAGDDLLGCARYGELEDLKSVVESGDVPIDYQNEGYNTALHYASANGNIDCVKYLLEKGARHLPNSSGNTPLHWAVQNKHIDVVRLLLDRIPDIDVLQKNDFGKSILTEAFGLDNADITQLLLQHTSASALDSGQSGIVEEETDEVANAEEDNGANQEGNGGGEENGAMTVECAPASGERMETDT